MTKMIDIAKDFSPFVAGRYRTDGPWSGQRFLEEQLLPALKTGAKVCVKLDGTLGLGSSFLEEAFGGLVRNGYTLETLRDLLEITGKKRTYISRTWQYIEDQDRKMSSRSGA